jgi:hypothetical protein
VPFQRPREAHAGLKTAPGRRGFLSGALYGHLRVGFIFQNSNFSKFFLIFQNAEFKT